MAFKTVQVRLPLLKPSQGNSLEHPHAPKQLITSAMVSCLVCLFVRRLRDKYWPGFHESWWESVAQIKFRSGSESQDGYTYYFSLSQNE